MIIDAISNAIRQLTRPASPPPPELLGLIDRRATALKSQEHGGRRWSEITGVTLHQTACVLGERPGRWDSVGAHLGVTRAGMLPWLHDFDRIVWHGNGFNRRTIGIEIDGMFPGVIGRKDTAWHGEMMEPTDAQIDATIRAVRWIDATVTAHGGKLRYVLAHRQSSATRLPDPGEGVWKRAALPLMAELGLSDGGDGFKVDDGAPIPREWDERRTARY